MKRESRARKSLSLALAGSIVRVIGPIWLEIDGRDFPGEGWDDFPVVILGWWLSEAKPLLTNQTGSRERLFMDGSYEFEVNVLGKELWEGALIKRGLDGKGEDVKVCLMEKKNAPKIFISEQLNDSVFNSTSSD